MALDDLLSKMEGRATDTPDTSCNPIEVSAKPPPNKACTLDTPDTSQNVSAEAWELCGTWMIDSTDGKDLPVTFVPAVDHAAALADPDGALFSDQTIDKDRCIAIAAPVVGMVKACRHCLHFAHPGKSDGYCSGRDDQPHAYGENHPLRQLPPDAGASCSQWVGV
ncbi:hypothetical protein [Dechloromonas sp. HYN0024]|uniref:hypothetical protein n=1 Tax=Dechloromonas sp. HYN0024 TaxID=2231055 RepID=UPI0013C33313|nr:hypothetical protein [Dechloromonas sp. HYN0024]